MWSGFPRGASLLQSPGTVTSFLARSTRESVHSATQVLTASHPPSLSAPGGSHAGSTGWCCRRARRVRGPLYRPGSRAHRGDRSP